MNFITRLFVPTLVIFLFFPLKESCFEFGKSSLPIDREPAVFLEPKKDLRIMKFEELLRGIYNDPKVEVTSLMTTEKGDSASGRIVKETADEITLDTTPCSQKKVLVAFHPIYKKKNVSKVTCGTNKYSRVKVTQA